MTGKIQHNHNQRPEPS